MFRLEFTVHGWLLVPSRLLFILRSVSKYLFESPYVTSFFNLVFNRLKHKPIFSRLKHDRFKRLNLFRLRRSPREKPLKKTPQQSKTHYMYTPVSTLQSRRNGALRYGSKCRILPYKKYPPSVNRVRCKVRDLWELYKLQSTASGRCRIGGMWSCHALGRVILPDNFSRFAHGRPP